MNAPVLELEGTWEEVAAHALELAGQRVRLTVLSAEEQERAAENPETRVSTAGTLLKFAGTWQGDDLRDCLDTAYQTRGEAEFRPNVFDRDED